MVRHFREFLEVKAKVGIRVLKVKGVSLDGVGLRVSDLPDEVEELGKIEGALEGGKLEEFESEDGKLLVEMETVFGNESLDWENRVTLCSKISGARFEMKGGYMGLMGEPMVLEVGSMKGKESLLVVLRVEGVLKDGTLLQDWVSNEDGGERWWKDELVGPWWDPAFDGRRKLRRRFQVPPTFLSFIGSGESDPFGGKTLGVMELLQKNGVNFGEGDWAVLYEKSSILEVVAGPNEMELIDGIIDTGHPVTMRIIRLCFGLVESNDKLTRASLKAGDFRIRQKVSHYPIAGQLSELRLGRNRMSMEVEAQIETWDTLVEARYTLESKVGGALKACGMFQVDQPVIVQQMKVGKNWRAWVLTASILRTKDFIEEEK